MCTVFALCGSIPGAPLVLAANRDEMLDRPWEPPAFAPGEPAIFMPRDARHGGTWLGVHRGGLVATVTNRLLFESDASRPSRGLLCRRALAAASVGAAVAEVRRAVAAQSYNGFHLLLGDAQGAVLLRYGREALEEVALTAGVHVFTSSHELDDPLLAPLRQRIAAAAGGSLAEFVRRAPAVLADHQPIGPRYTVCKHGDLYGTRSAALVALSPAGAVDFYFAGGRPCEASWQRLAPFARGSAA